MGTDTCETCRFWLRPEDPGPVAPQGECRRHPPQVVGQTQVQPWTSPGYWCGEHSLPGEKAAKEAALFDFLSAIHGA